MTRISIIGTGFGALKTARELRRRDPKADITLIAPNAELVYLPSLIWVPTGLRNGEDLRFPLTGELRRQRLNFHFGNVLGLEDGGRRVLTDRGSVDNDGLVIASGARFLKAMPGIEHVQSVCEGIDAAQRIRERLRSLNGGTLAFAFATNPAETSALRGGPVFELMFGIDTWLRREKRRSSFDLVFFAPMAQPGQRLGPRAMGGLLQQMKKRSIKTVLGNKLAGFEANRVKTEGGGFHADMIVFMHGMAGPAWAEHAGLPLSAGGFFKADEFCRVEGADGVFVVGDAGSFPGPDWLPKQAHMAELQGGAAAANLLRTLRGLNPVARPKAELICIVDMLDSGVLVYRSEHRAIVYGSRWLHSLKLLIEWRYLRPLRRDRDAANPVAARG